MCTEMVEEDLRLARRDALLNEHGHNVSAPRNDN
jgi:hypothetical protein